MPWKAGYQSMENIEFYKSKMMECLGMCVMLDSHPRGTGDTRAEIFPENQVICIIEPVVLHLNSLRKMAHPRHGMP